MEMQPISGLLKRPIDNNLHSVFNKTSLNFFFSQIHCRLHYVTLLAAVALHILRKTGLKAWKVVARNLVSLF